MNGDTIYRFYVLNSKTEYITVKRKNGVFKLHFLLYNRENDWNEMDEKRISNLADKGIF